MLTDGCLKISPYLASVVGTPDNSTQAYQVQSRVNAVDTVVSLVVELLPKTLTVPDC